jgi:hypothetical protein
MGSNIKKYYLADDTDSLELFIFPEDMKSTLETTYSKLNKYGVYPYRNVRSHSITIRYSDRYTLNKIEAMALKALDTGNPIQFSSVADYAARHSNSNPIPSSDLSLSGLESKTQLLEIEISKELELEDYEFDLDNNLEPYLGFIEIPLDTEGLIGRGKSLEGFSLKITEIEDVYREILVGCLTLKIPPESYSYEEEQVINGEVMYSSDGQALIRPSYIRKGFTINLSSCYADLFNTLVEYRETGWSSGLDVLDNVGNSFNGRGRVEKVSLNGGGIVPKAGDTSKGAFIPGGLSFSIMSLDTFVVA